MRLRKKRFTIYQKLLTAFLLTILPVSLLGIVLNQQVAISLKEQITLSMRTNIDFYVNALKSELDLIEHYKQTLSFDNDLATLATLAPALTEDERRERILDLEQKLALFAESSPYIKNVYFYIPLIDKTIVPDNYIVGAPYENLGQLREYAQQHLSPLLLWEDKLITHSFYPDYIIEGRQPVYSIIVEIDQEKILQHLSKAIEQGGVLLYFHEDKQLLSNKGIDSQFTEVKRFMEQNTDDSQARDHLIEDDSGERYLLASQPLSEYGISISIFTPESIILSDFDRYNYMFWLLLLVSAIVIVIFTFWIYKAIRNPLYKLLHAFRKVKTGDLAIQIDSNSNDEFRDLYGQFNNTVDQLRSLIQEVYEQKIRSQQSELKQLQTQINPHFLYNSFFILHQLIEQEDIDNSKRFVDYLGHYFQYITRNAVQEVLLTEELSHTTAYLNIQSMRFGARIQIEIEELPLECKYVEVPRLIIQPIVENAYQYGLESQPAYAMLRITNTIEEDMLYLFIEDNGTQLSDERLEELRHSFQPVHRNAHLESTGLLNVHRRLQIKFGEDAGLEAYRSELGGLGVCMRIPLETGADL